MCLLQRQRLPAPSAASSVPVLCRCALPQRQSRRPRSDASAVSWSDCALWTWLCRQRRPLQLQLWRRSRRQGLQLLVAQTQQAFGGQQLAGSTGVPCLRCCRLGASLPSPLAAWIWSWKTRRATRDTCRRLWSCAPCCASCRNEQRRPMRKRLLPGRPASRLRRLCSLPGLRKALLCPMRQVQALARQCLCPHQQASTCASTATRGTRRRGHSETSCRRRHRLPRRQR